MYTLSFIKLFAAGFVIDLLYVWYFKAVTAGHKLKAGTMSVLLAAPALFGFVEVSKDYTLAAPYLLGLFCGTIAALSMRR